MIKQFRKLKGRFSQSSELHLNTLDLISKLLIIYFSFSLHFKCKRTHLFLSLTLPPPTDNFVVFTERPCQPTRRKRIANQNEPKRRSKHSEFIRATKTSFHSKLLISPRKNCHWLVWLGESKFRFRSSKCTSARWFPSIFCWSFWHFIKWPNGLSEVNCRPSRPRRTFRPTPLNTNSNCGQLTCLCTLSFNSFHCCSSHLGVCLVMPKTLCPAMNIWLTFDVAFRSTRSNRVSCPFSPNWPFFLTCRSPSWFLCCQPSTFCSQSVESVSPSATR